MVLEKYRITVRLDDLAVFENRQPVTAAKFITKSSLFILLHRSPPIYRKRTRLIRSPDRIVVFCGLRLFVSHMSISGCTLAKALTLTLNFTHFLR